MPRAATTSLASHTWSVTIAGVNRTAKIQKGTLKGDWTRGGYANLSFSTFDTVVGSGAYRPAVDQEVLLVIDGVLTYRGFITDLADAPLGGHRSGTAISVKCTDFSSLLDRVTVTKSYGGIGTILWSGTNAPDVPGGVPAGMIPIRMHEPHGWVTGDPVRIAGHTPFPGDSDINGDHIITVPTTFTGDPAEDYWIAATFFIVAPPRTATGGAGTARRTYTLHDIVADIVATYLTPNYGITLDPAMVTGPVMEPASFTGSSVTEVWKALTDVTGFVNRVLPTKQQQFFLPGTKNASFGLDGTNTNTAIQWQQSRRQFANRVIVFAGGTQKIVATETVVHTGGPSSEYQLGYPASQDINDTWPNVLYADGVNVSVVGWGPEQLAGSGPAWYWDYHDGGGDRQNAKLVQQAGAVNPAAGAVLTLTYTRQYPVKVIAEAANDTQPPPAGRGPWELVVEAPNVTDKGQALTLANQTLAQNFSQAPPKELQLGTMRGYAFPGDTMALTFPDRTISGAWIIESVGFSFLNPFTMTFDYKFIEGSAIIPTWIDDFQELITTGGGGSGVSVSSAPGGGGGGSGGGADEVFVGPSDPGAPFELWWDTDDPTAPFGGVGSGTIGYLAKWATTSTLTNSILSESGSAVLIEGSLTVTGAVSVLDHTFTVSKLQRVPSQTILGRQTTGADSVEVLTTLPTGVQDRITRVGTVTSGVWQATPIGLTYLAGAGTQGTFVRSTGANWATSTLMLPNTAFFQGVVYGTGTNTWGQSANLMFTGTQLWVTGDIVVSGYIGSPNYASQTSGWRIDATGGADFRYLFVDEMHAKSFITDLEMALAGGQIISKSVAMVAVPFAVPSPGGSSILRVKDLPSMPDQAAYQYGDTVVLRRFTRSGGDLTIADCIGQVSGYVDQADGTQTWTFIRYGGADGGAMSGGTVPVDALALDYGVSGSGYYEVNAIDGSYGVNSPYAQIVTWVTSPTGAHKTVRARYGNLYGITGVGGEYGLIAGTYAPTSGSYLRASNTTFELHNITAEWWSGAVPVIKISPSNPSWGAPVIALGYPAPASWGQAGVFMAYDGSGHAMFRLTSLTGGTYFAFDGVSLYWQAANTQLDPSGNLHATSAVLSGSVTATSGSITGDMVIGGAGQIRSGAVAYDTGVGWWLDYNGGTPRFRVGNPASDRLTWDGAGVNIISHDLKIDGSAGGHVGMGGSPYILATLNVASKTNGTDTWGLVVSNASGNANFICYGDGSVYINSLIRSNPVLDHTGAGTNPPSIWNGPFGQSELDGWWQLIINGVTSWIPVWQ